MQNYTNKLIFQLLFLFCTLPTLSLSAQELGRLSGYVSDASTGEPLPASYVIDLETGKGTSTNGNGRYSFKLPVGLRTIKVQLLSFRDTTFSINVLSDEETFRDVLLFPESLTMDEIVVDAARVANTVRSLARFRDKNDRSIRSYKVDVYKVAILYNIKDSDTLKVENGEAAAFSERFGTVNHVAPDRYSETIKGRRASKNFFSEFDFFATSGRPLNLNQNRVPVSILTEDITVAGPISVDGRRFYEFYDKPAGSEWPEGTIEITLEPKFENRALFRGKIWFREETNEILGMDVRLNDYAKTNNGLFEVSDLRYQQEYTQVEGHWMPSKTKLSARVSMIGVKQDIFYTDEWAWSNYRLNGTTGLQLVNVPLSGQVFDQQVDSRDDAYWDNISSRSKNENVSMLDEAESYTESRAVVNVGMSALRAFFRLPAQMQNGRFTTMSDYYRYNRVEGHFLGLGLRTKRNPRYEYLVKFGYATSEDDWRGKFSVLQYVPKTFLAFDGAIYKDLAFQYLDYAYAANPLDFTDFRVTLSSLFAGAPRNYFEREGFSAGLRYKFDNASFLRVRFMNEEHNRLFTNETSTFIADIDQEDIPNEEPLFPFEEGYLRGLSFQLHYDNRQFTNFAFIRNYNVRSFGLLGDFQVDTGFESWGSDFDFTRYRAALMFNIPAFSSQFIQIQIYSGASSRNTPSQRLFTFNGWRIDDYVLEQPFPAIDFREPIGSRVTLTRVRYRFGSGLTRKIPIRLIRESGVQFTLFGSAGVVDQDQSMAPLLPTDKNVDEQVEVGFALAQIFGVLYFEYSQRVVGDFGNSFGIVFPF